MQASPEQGAATDGSWPPCLQPLLLYTCYLQVPGLFAQLTDPGHVGLQLPPVGIQDADSDEGPLPFILAGHLDNRGIEAGPQTVLQTTHGTAFVLKGPGPWNKQFDGEQGNRKVWIRHGVEQMMNYKYTAPPSCSEP